MSATSNATCNAPIYCGELCSFACMQNSQHAAVMHAGRKAHGQTGIRGSGDTAKCTV